MTDFESLFDAGFALHRAYKKHREIDVEVDTRNDTIGLSAGVRFMIPMPPNTTAIASLESTWGITVGSRDDHLFRDTCGDFHTVAPISNQVAAFYIPYGVIDHRKAGIYTMRISVIIPETKSRKGCRLATASTKIALPPPPVWHKIEYLWPFIALCMTVVRSDQEISRREIRRLKTLLIKEFRLKPADMEGLRLAMKTPPPDNIELLLSTVRTRMPYLDPKDLVATLLRVACSDGPVNQMEHTTLRTIAAHVGLDDHTWARLVDQHVY